MVLFIIFLLCNIFVVGIVAFVYKPAPSYQDGMILGVHISENNLKNPEIQTILSQHHKKMKHFYLLHFFISIAICFLYFWYISIFMIVWCIWICWFCIKTMENLFHTHRKLYKVKSEHGWGTESIDNDYYWRKGWYSNPDDSRLFVPDRYSSTNYSLNYGRSKSKWFLGITLAICLALLLWMCSVFLKMDFTPIELAQTGNQFTITSLFSVTSPVQLI